jgi:hypothetical protein
MIFGLKIHAPSGNPGFKQRLDVLLACLSFGGKSIHGSVTRGQFLKQILAPTEKLAPMAKVGA